MDFLVHQGEAAGQAALGGLAGGQIVEAVQEGLDQLGDGGELLAAPAPADGVDLLLGDLQNVLGFAQALLDHAGDLSGGLGQGAEERLVLDDLDVFHDVGAGGRDLHQLDQIGPGGLVVVGAVFLHFLGYCDAVDGLGVAEHGVDGLKDVTVLLDIEVVGLELVHDVLDAVGVDEHGTQGGLFCLQAVGHLPGENFIFKSHCDSPFSLNARLRAGTGASFSPKGKGPKACLNLRFKNP